MQVVNYRLNILQHEDSKTDYLSKMFSKIFRGKLSIQSTSTGKVFFTKIEGHKYVFQT